MTLRKKTPLSEVRDALDCEGNLCNEIDNYFSDYLNMTYGDAITAFKKNIKTDKKMSGRVTVNLVKLVELNTQRINSTMINLLLDNNVISKMQALLIWRKIKDSTNISDNSKQKFILYLKGYLPQAEKKEEYHHTLKTGVRQIEEDPEVTNG